MLKVRKKRFIPVKSGQYSVFGELANQFACRGEAKDTFSVRDKSMFGQTGESAGRKLMCCKLSATISHTCKDGKPWIRLITTETA